MNHFPRSFGQYQLLSELGRGGFAIVYRAHDTVLGREVALKVLHEQFAADMEGLVRFQTEAKAVARLQHPHIIWINSTGEYDGRPYIDMRLLRGQTLDTYLGSLGVLSVKQALPILQQIADALDYAHTNKVVHRDVKPSNVIIDTTGKITLTDFGLATALEASWPKLTRTGQVLGTVEYMAPEQLDTDTDQQVGPATDIYAFGVLTYQLLIGYVPFSGSTFKVALAHIHKTPPNPRQFRENLPESVAKAILRALAKEPVKRFPTANGFVNALRASETPTRIINMTKAKRTRPVILPTNAHQLTKLQRLGNGKEKINQVAFSPDGLLLAVAGGSGIQLYDVQSGAEVRYMRTATGVKSIDFSPNCELLVSGYQDGIIQIWKVVSGENIKTLTTKVTWTVFESLSVVFSPDGQQIALAINDSGGGVTVYWHVASGNCLGIGTDTGKILGSWEHNNDQGRSTSPNRQFIAYSDLNRVFLWNMQEPKLLNGHTGTVNVVSFSPNSKLLASGSADKTVQLWEVASGRQVHILRDHSQTVISVAFAPDGRSLASASWDGTIRLWGVVK